MAVNSLPCSNCAMRSITLAALKVCDYQVAGHRGSEGKLGCLVDGSGRFYKPLQAGERGAREAAFYESLRIELEGSANRCSGADGVVELDGSRFLELEDVAHGYRRPCIMDVKLGRQTWYPGADPAYAERCAARDAATMQAAVGFRICGLQVHQRRQGSVWRASKPWCKALQPQDVPAALARFAECGGALSAADIYGGPRGAATQLQRLEHWFKVQREFLFYSASVLIVYEGDAGAAGEAHVSVRLIDFAHAFPSCGARDENCLEGVESLRGALCRASGLPEDP